MVACEWLLILLFYIHELMALNSHSQDFGEEIDIVCGALCAKLLPMNLTCVTSCCVSFEDELLTPCEFEHHARRLSSKNRKTSIQVRGK